MNWKLLFRMLLPDPCEGAHVTKPPQDHVLLFKKIFTSLIDENVSNLLMKLNFFEKLFWLFTFPLSQSEVPSPDCQSFSVGVLTFLWSIYLCSKYLLRAFYVPGALPGTRTQQRTKRRSVPSREPIWWGAQTVNTATRTRFVKALRRFRMITLCHMASPVCHLFYNFICILVCLREPLNFFSFLFWHDFRFTAKLRSWYRQLPCTLRPAFPDISSLHNCGTFVD